MQADAPIQMLWIGNQLSPIEQLCMKSFLYHGHQVDLFAYSDINGVPSDVTIRDASEIIEPSKVFKHRNSYAAFVDLFRWALLGKRGGYYCDTDVLCLKPFEFDESIVIGTENKDFLTTCVLGFDNSPLANQFADDMLYEALHPLEWRSWDSMEIKRKKLFYRFSPKKYNAVGWGYTSGPIGLNNVYYHKGYDFALQDVSKFCHVSYGDWRKFIEPNALSFEDFPEMSMAAHLWNEMWSRGGIDKYSKFDKDSFIGKAMDKYL